MAILSVFFSIFDHSAVPHATYQLGMGGVEGDERFIDDPVRQIRRSVEVQLAGLKSGKKEKKSCIREIRKRKALSLLRIESIPLWPRTEMASSPDIVAV